MSSYDYKISKEDNRNAIIGTVLVHILLILFLIFYSVVTMDPPFPNEAVLMEMDFSGSESAGGAPTEVSESKESSANTEDVATQEEESPVTVTKGTKTTTTKTTNTTTSTETKTQDPKYTFGSNTFGNGNSGSGTGTTDGDGANGNGDGISGPGSTGTTGTGDGSGRSVTYKPTPNNPIQETGSVVVKVWINREGNVINAVALSSHPSTQVTNTIHLDEAVKIAYKFKFSKNPTGYEKETKEILINFTLN